MEPFEIVANVLRGERSECVHFGAASVWESGRGQVARIGDPSQETFARSAVKPFQALPLLLAGGVESFELEAEDVAIVCASHSGGPEHVARVRRLLSRAGLSVDLLACGAHPPLSEVHAQRMNRAGEAPSALHNNCSGKHAGMLMACLLRGYGLSDYLYPSHPLQLEIRGYLAELAGLDADGLYFGIDGCSAPTGAFSLTSMARLYGHLAIPEEARIELQDALETAYASMVKAPEMVAGKERFTTQLMQHADGRLLAKEGAEGLYAMAVRLPGGSGRRLGIALKIFDGGERCRDAVVLQLLRDLEVFGSAELEALSAFYRPERRNVRGLLVGRIVPVGGLLKACT